MKYHRLLPFVTILFISWGSNAQNNWSEVISFNNNGNVLSQTRTYIDGIGRTIQQQSTDNANNNVLASQPVFDAFGRPVLQTLSAPLFQNSINFKDKFIEDASGNNYSWDDFDKPNTSSTNFGEINMPAPVQNTLQGTLGWYYSNNNVAEPYVASSSYPYNRIEYFDDPLGRVKRMTIAGENHRMGTGHEKKTFYLTNAGELYYVFGYNESYITGFSNNNAVSTGKEDISAFKTIEIDENGKENVSYTNSNGQVIATCLTGIPTSCVSQKVNQTLFYYGQRGVSIHLPASKKGTLKLITANVGYGILANEGSSPNSPKQVNYSITDLRKGYLLVEGIDYVIDRNTRSVTFKNIYQFESSYFRISYEYTSLYLTANFDLNNQGGTKWDPKFIPNLSISYELDYSNWSINYYTKKGELSKVVSPNLVDCSYDPFANNTTSTDHVEKPVDYVSVLHSVGTVPLMGYQQSLEFKVELTGYSNPLTPGNGVRIRSQDLSNHNVSATLPELNVSPIVIDEEELETQHLRTTSAPTPDGQLIYALRVTFNINGDLVQGGITSITNGVFQLDTYTGHNIITIPLSGNVVKNYSSIKLYITNIEILVYKFFSGSFQLDHIEPFVQSNTIHSDQTNHSRIVITTKLQKYPRFEPIPDTKILTYSYNSFGWPIKNTSPDEGIINFIYDTEGKLRFKQNAQQLIDGGRFNYYVYDRAGRIVETGEFNPSLRVSGPILSFQPYTSSGSTPNPIEIGSVHAVVDFTQAEWTAYSTHCTQQTWFAYDKSDDLPITYSGYDQRFQDNQLSKSWTIAGDASWYGYDYDDRCIWAVHSLNVLGIKTINYHYTKEGNLDKIDYQKEEPAERFIHQYIYDSNNRLHETATSFDNVSFKSHQTLKYYLHNALKRNELGGNLQGLDYVYTINGQLKSVNDPTLTNRDPGKDGYAGVNLGFNKDVFGFTLDYFPGDYTRKNTYVETYSPNVINTSATYIEPFNGNIRCIRWQTALPVAAASTSTFTSGMLQYVYKYDYQNQLSEAVFGSVLAGTSNGPTIGTGSIFAEDPNAYRINNLTYDKIGNVKTLKRQGEPSELPMDDLVYNYSPSLPNRLNSINDIASNYSDDLKNQSSSNYIYNNIGQLINDFSADYVYIYNLAGKVLTITNSDGKYLLRFEYNPAGLRQKKITYDNNGDEAKYTWYIYGEGGELMSIYETNIYNGTLLQTELPIYGEGRIGIYDKRSSSYVYEISDYMGNVRAVVRNNAGAAEVLSFSDYYPHGSIMPGRNFSLPLKYRFGYQGQEEDTETGFNNFELRHYDCRLGRWFNPDPMGQYNSPYLAMGNNPINKIDPTGGSDYDPEDHFWDNYLAGEEYYGSKPWEAMSPMERNLQQEKSGTSYASQEFNKIMTLASLGGYEDKNGKIWEIDKNNNFIEKIDEQQDSNSPDKPIWQKIKDGFYSIGRFFTIRHGRYDLNRGGRGPSRWEIKPHVLMPNLRIAGSSHNLDSSGRPFAVWFYYKFGQHRAAESDPTSYIFKLDQYYNETGNTNFIYIFGRKIYQR
ncbi:MAG: RHS repeat-associated core domain-containing protein [Saprospiraceae bacterium]